MENNRYIPLSIPQVYERYLGPYIFEPFAIEIASRIKNNPTRILEIASGTGRVTKHIVNKIGDKAQLMATDINPNMLEISKQNVLANNVEFLVADAQELPFKDGTFDCVICQFGFMFLPNRQNGFNEAFRVLKNGGQFLFSTWDKSENNITYHISHQTVLKYLKTTAPQFYGRPYSMYNPNDLKTHVNIAGFKKVEINRITLEGISPSALDVATGFVEGNAIIHEIMKEGPELLEQIKTSIVHKIHNQVSKDPVHSKLNAWIGEAFR